MYGDALAAESGVRPIPAADAVQSPLLLKNKERWNSCFKILSLVPGCKF